MKRKTTFITLALLLSTAQSAPGEEDKDYLELEEIVVSAERREENLQRVPISITTLTGEDLNESAIESTLDLQQHTPGFVFTTNSVMGQPFIRGVGSNFISIGSENTVAVYSDGVYQARAVQAITDLFDIDRIEIIKGPQGTLYGRNATGGALNIISKIPEPDLAAEADFLYGNFNKLRTRAVVNIPVIEDKVFFRLSSLTSNRNGFTKVINRGTTTDDEDLWSLRAQTRIFASDNIEILLSADYLAENGSRALGSKINNNLPAPQVDFFGGTNPKDPRKVLNDIDNNNTINVWGLSGKTIWDAGSLEVKSITAFRETDWNLLIDIDATEVDYGISDPNENSKTFTQEFQLTSTIKSPFQWVAGVFYLNEDSSQKLDFISNAIGLRINTFADNVVNAYAVFGQGSYFLTDRWRFTGGGRYSYEKKHHVLKSGPGGTLINDGKNSWDAFMPKLSIDYFATKDIMTYFSISSGFKSGGYNSAGVGEEFDPEFIWSYELGLKSTLFDDRLRFNTAAFFYDYKDLQVQRSLQNAPAAVILENAASAEIKGLEAEIFARPYRGWDINLGLAILDARFTEFISIDPDAPDPTVNRDLSGNTLPQAPEFMANAGIQYKWSIMNYGDMSIRGEWKYQSEMFFNQFNTQGVNQKEYSLFNARLGLKSADNHWDFALWGKNLTDTLYKQTVIRNTRLIGTLNFWGAPRTFGFQMAYKY